MNGRPARRDEIDDEMSRQMDLVSQSSIGECTHGFTTENAYVCATRNPRESR